jgi:LysR family transcriptional regulator, nitrogen assimilation regulatory protein
MDYQALETFLRVAELGSMSKAAIELHRSQPALSRQIAQLERVMGAPLFTRTAGGVHLTAAGRALCIEARPLLAELSQLLKRVAGEAEGSLSVGIPRSWRSVVTARFVAEVLRQHAGISLRVGEGISSALREQAHAGGLDLSIVPFEEDPQKGYAHTALVREPLLLIAPRDHALSPDTPVPFSRFDSLAMVLPPKPNCVRLRLEHALARRGINCRLVAEMDSLALGLQLVAEGLACSVAPSCAMQDLREMQDRVCWAPIQGLAITWALCENLARTDFSAVRTGRRLLLDTVQNAVVSQHWCGAEWVASVPA